MEFGEKSLSACHSDPLLGESPESLPQSAPAFHRLAPIILPHHFAANSVSQLAINVFSCAGSGCQICSGNASRATESLSRAIMFPQDLFRRKSLDKLVSETTGPQHQLRRLL